MRVALGLHSLQLGGSQVNTVDLASNLRSRGHHVVLFAISHHEYRATIVPIATEAGFDIQVLPGEPSLTAQARHVKELVEHHRADVLHVFHENHVLGPIACIAMRSRPDTAVVVTNWMMENTRWLPRYAPLIVGTEGLRKEAARHHRGPVWLIEPPVNVDRDRPAEGQGQGLRRTLGVADSEILLTLVSRIDRKMKLDAITCAIRAVEQMEDHPLRLVIVGDGDAADDVRTLAEQANEALGRRAILRTGTMNDPRAAYAAADIVLGMGGSALRGLAFAKPVIVLGAGDFARPFTTATAAYFMEHGFYGEGRADLSGSALSVQLRALLDSETRRSLGELGVQTVRERFALPAATTRLEIIYERALQRPVPAWARLLDVTYVLAYRRMLGLMPSDARTRLKAVLMAARRARYPRDVLQSSISSTIRTIG